MTEVFDNDISGSSEDSPRHSIPHVLLAQNKSEQTQATNVYRVSPQEVFFYEP
jgi:hypothetical protein